MQLSEAQRLRFLMYAETFLGAWYRWGGDDPSGIDCSGLVVECLKGVGMMKESEDLTANGLYHRFLNAERPIPKRGHLAFWFAGNKATHVAICIDPYHCITAEGGGSTTHTEKDAIKQNAFVKIRPIDKRSAPVKYVDPFM